MRTIIISMAMLFMFGLLVNDAAAKGFGGRGFSSFRAKSFSNFSRAKTTNRTPGGARPWQSSIRGALGGMILGGLISSLFFGHGFGSAVFSWLVVGTLLMLCISMLRRQRNFKNDPRS
jgi:uncharacterized membrane protein